MINIMQKEAKIMKAMIIRSGLQKNGFSITKEAIQNMYNQHNIGKPLINKIDYTEDKICGYLNHTTLEYNEELDELELWGYFVYTCDGLPFSQRGFCSYMINYDSNDMDDEKVLHRCTLMSCMMFIDEEH